MPDSIPPDPLDGLLQLLLEDQRGHWQRGERLLVEVYLGQHPELCQRVESLLSLLYNEIILREKQGERPGRSRCARADMSSVDCREDYAPFGMF